jgi:pilus assembly protein TadC
VLWGVASLVSAMLAAAAVFLWMEPRASAVVPPPVGERAGRGPRRVWQLPPARPDAAPLRRRVLVASGAALASGLALGGLGAPELLGWAVTPFLALTGVVVLGRLEPSVARERRTRLIIDLPQALELLSACLAAGMPLRQATRAVAAAFDGPVSDDLGQLLVLVDLGTSDADAWRSLRGNPQWGAAAGDLARSVESGTMMVEVLMHHARASRDLRRAALEVKAKAVGVRSVLPLMTCFLPAFLLVGVVPTVASAVINALW